MCGTRLGGGIAGLEFICSCLSGRGLQRSLRGRQGEGAYGRTYSWVAGEGGSLAVVGVGLALVDTLRHVGYFGDWLGMKLSVFVIEIL